MAQLISGPGVFLPPPQNLYPVTLNDAPFTPQTNQFALPAAATKLIPAGTWFVTVGTVSAVQWRDPVTTQWNNINPVGTAFGTTIRSDGQNFRVANLSGAAYAATFTAGSGYAQATTTITAGTGNSTWQPVIGGAVGTITVTAGGTGYSKIPHVYIPPPPWPGVQATAHATLSSTAVATVVVDSGHAGAGYLTAPPILILPDANDPNLAAGLITTAATATCVLTGAGTLTGVILLNFGSSLSTQATLTVSGAGSSATATATPSTVVAPAVDVIYMQPASAS